MCYCSVGRLPNNWLGHIGEFTLYPISLGFDEAVNRIETLLKNGHDAEALVTSVFTLEKTMRRSLKIAILARGFSLKQSQRFTERKGFGELKEMWDLFDKEHRTLPIFIGNQDWQNIPTAVEMRNKLVHGTTVYKLSKCKEFADHVLTALMKLRTTVQSEYRRDPWQRITGKRNPRLQWIA